MHEDRVVEDNCHEVSRPYPQSSLDNSKRVFENRSSFLSHKDKSKEEPTQEKENID